MSHDVGTYLPKPHPLSPDQRATLLKVSARTGSPSLRVLFDHIAYLEQDNRGSRCGVNHSLEGEDLADPAAALCVECAEQASADAMYGEDEA